MRFRYFSRSFVKILLPLSLVLCFAPVQRPVFSENGVNTRGKEESPIEQLKKMLKKREKQAKIESGPSPISSKEIKSYCQSELKALNIKLAELDGSITKSKAVYDRKKQEAWALFIEQGKMERSNEQDADKILDLHERLSDAKAAEAEALTQYRNDARNLLATQRKIEQCQDEIKKANKVLNFIGQTK